MKNIFNSKTNKLFLNSLKNSNSFKLYNTNKLNFSNINDLNTGLTSNSKILNLDNLPVYASSVRYIIKNKLISINYYY